MEVIKTALAVIGLPTLVFVALAGLDELTKKEYHGVKDDQID